MKHQNHALTAETDTQSGTGCIKNMNVSQDTETKTFKNNFQVIVIYHLAPTMS